ncbi:MAG: Hsp70 family protein, partial [Actinomycetota bacterium]|nr:Hsp70 family protein [Actinomycetota bacterium]
MNYALGVDVGTSFTAAAIWRRDEGKTEAVALGSRMPSVPSVLFLGADGAVVVGEAAERRALTDPDRVVREFKRRIGDDTPLFVGGQPYAAQDLAAMMVRWVVDRVTEREGGPPDRIAITHPAGWGPFKKDLLSRALNAVGLNDVTFLAEPEAAAVSYAAQQRIEAGTTIAVYDLGGGTFDAAVVRKTGADSFALLGTADGLQQLGGADFDEAVFSHVQALLAAQPGTVQWDTLDVEDPSVLSGLARLRRECTEAKEALSSDTEVTIPVLLPGANTQVRLVRGDFEEMIRPAIEDTVDSLSRAIRSADVSSDELGAVLLVGGSSRMPLVFQLVSARLGCPVRVDADPQTSIALGAALSMAPTAQPVTTPTVAIEPVVVVPDPEAHPSLENLPNPMVDQAPQRPPLIPTQRESVEDRESTGNSGRLREKIKSGLLLNITAVGLLAGVLMTSLAVTAPGDDLPAASGSVSGSVSPPGDTVASDGSGRPADNAGSPNVASNGKKATNVGRTTAPVPEATADRRPPARPGAQGGQVGGGGQPTGSGQLPGGGGAGGGEAGGGGAGGGEAGGG